MEESFSRKFVTDMIERYGVIIKNGIVNGREYWMLDNLTVISLPEGHKRVPLSVVEIIAQDQLGIHHTELDYWIGENG